MGHAWVTEGVFRDVSNKLGSLNTCKNNTRALTTLGPDVIKLFSCSTQLSTKFILLINVKMPTILTVISMINKYNKQETSLFAGVLVFMSS